MAAIAPVAPVPARQASPGAVFWACFLLFGVAALRVVSAIGSFYALPQVTRYYADAHGDGTAGTVAGVGLILLAVLSLVYALLALFDSRGMDPARTITWVVLLALPAAHRFYLARRHLRQQARPTFRYPPQPPPGAWYPPPPPRPVPPGPALGWPPPPGPMPLPPLRPAFRPAPPPPRPMPPPAAPPTGP
jgi:hypothetical protein